VNNYLRIYWTDFRNLFTKWKRSGWRWSIWTYFFRYLKGRCHGNQFCEKNGKFPSFVALAFRNGMGYRYVNESINSINDASVSCKNFVNLGPVTPELTCSFVNFWYDTTKNWHIQSNFSWYTGLTFATVWNRIWCRWSIWSLFFNLWRDVAQHFTVSYIVRILNSGVTEPNLTKFIQGVQKWLPIILLKSK